MVDVKVATVYKFDYEMNESLWTAYIAGFTQDEAFVKLQSLVPPGQIKKVNSIEQQCRLDSISKQMIDEISKPLLQQIEAMRTKPTITEAKIESTPVVKKSPGRPKKVK